MKMQVRIALLAVVVLAGKAQAQAIEVFGAIAASAQAFSDMTIEINSLVQNVNSSIGLVEQRIASLSNSFKTIVSTKQPQVVVTSSFGAIDKALGLQEVIMPLVKELIDIVSIMSDKLLPAIGKFPGVPVEVAQTGKEMSNVITMVNRVKDAIAVWNVRIRQLAADIGAHVLVITQQIEGTVADVQKIF